MGGDRRPVDAIHRGQLTDPTTGFVVRDQSLDLDRGEPAFNTAQFTDARTPRILKPRVSPHLAGLTDPLDKPLYQGFRGRTGV